MTSLLDITLDPAQRALVTRPPGDALLVLGEAGHGKTTVALHRLAHLYRTMADLRARVIVPHEGLARMLEQALRELGVDVPVRTYERWARRQTRRRFPELPRRERAALAAVVAYAKRHPALHPQLIELAEHAYGSIDDDLDARPSRRADLQQLFGDRTRVTRLVQDANISTYAIDALLDHTRRQFSSRTESEYRTAHDRTRLQTLDGRTIDAGTLDEVAESLDAEDYAIVFELARLRGERGVPRRLDCLVLDEAQELAPIELALLGGALRTDGTLIVAGDADQRTSEGLFVDWDTTLTALGRPQFERAWLQIGYRCPPQVVQIARALRAGAIAEATVTRHADLDQLARWLVQRTESGCVLTRTPRAARQITEALHRYGPARYVSDGRFVPRGLRQVAIIDDVRGLEMDDIAIVDLDATTYPDDPAARRALYVAVTRARKHLWLATTGAPTSLLAPT